MSKKRKHSTSKKSEKAGSSEKRAAKKAAVLGTKKKNHLSLITGAICLSVAAGGVGLYYINNNQAKPSVAVESPVTTQSSSTQSVDVVTYPASLFIGGAAKFFEYQHGDTTIKYFILRSSDGVIRAAFDACDVCWPAGKGYYQDGDHMVCRNCGRRFASILVNEVKGGCNPAPLNRSIKDHEVVIQVKDILEGQKYFDFSQRT